MRIIRFAVAASFALAPFAGDAGAAPSDRTDFVAWALEQGAECDERWENATGRSGGPAAGPNYPATRAGAFPRNAFPRAASKSRSAVDFCSPSGLVPALLSGVERLSLSTRERAAPTRGKPAGVSTAETGLNELSAQIRSFESSLQWTNSFHTKKNTVRPALNSCRRLSRSYRVGSPARPASRAFRPRKF